VYEGLEEALFQFLRAEAEKFGEGGLWIGVYQKHPAIPAGQFVAEISGKRRFADTTRLIEDRYNSRRHRRSTPRLLPPVIINSLNKSHNI
jgi:hypothetical protein